MRKIDFINLGVIHMYSYVEQDTCCTILVCYSYVLICRKLTRVTASMSHSYVAICSIGRTDGQDGRTDRTDGQDGRTGRTDGQPDGVMSHNALYDIGTEILIFHCFCIMEMFLFSTSIIAGANSVNISRRIFLDRSQGLKCTKKN